MKKDSIINSIRTQRLQLDVFESFIYFKVPVLCFLASAMSITNGFQEFPKLGNDMLSKVGIILLLIGLINYKLKFDLLKLKVVENPLTNFKERILNLAAHRNWKIELNNYRAIIFKTTPVRGYHEYTERYNKHEGERIFVFIEQNKIYLKSINNLDNILFTIDNGENREHESALVQTIKPAGNTAFAQCLFLPLQRLLGKAKLFYISGYKPAFPALEQMRER